MKLSLVALSLAFAGLITTGVSGGATSGTPESVRAIAASPTPAIPAAPSPARVFITNPNPVFRPTGGPFITPAEAVANATRRARPTPAGKESAARPIYREAVALMTYGDVVSWSGGSRTQRIDLAREVYLVVFSTRYVPKHSGGAPFECNWVAVVVDASDGTAWELHCGADPWPRTLPAGLAHLV